MKTCHHCGEIMGDQYFASHVMERHPEYIKKNLEEEHEQAVLGYVESLKIGAEMEKIKAMIAELEKRQKGEELANEVVSVIIDTILGKALLPEKKKEQP